MSDSEKNPTDPEIGRIKFGDSGDLPVEIEVDADPVNANWLCEDYWDKQGRYIGPGSTEEDWNEPPRLSREERLKAMEASATEMKELMKKWAEDQQHDAPSKPTKE